MAAAPPREAVTPERPEHRRDPPPRRLRSIDALRGLAAVAVVCGHSGAILLGLVAEPSRGMHLLMTVLALAHFGVPLFFVISGFCIHLPHARESASGTARKMRWRAFWNRRIRRLYPPYLAALILSTALALFAPLARVDRVIGASVPGSGAWPAITDFGAHLLMLHSLHPKLMFGGGNAVYWTLALEEYFYLLYLPLIGLHRRLGAFGCVAMLAGASILFPLAMQAFLAPESPWWVVVGYSVPTLWVQWHLGMIAVEAHYGLRKLPDWCSRCWLAPVWLCGAVLAEEICPAAAPGMAGIACFILVNALVRREAEGRWFNGSPARLLASSGRFSYSLYLVHIPIIVICANLIPKAALVGDAAFAAATIAIVLICLGAGRLFFQLVERHFLAPAPLAT